MFRFPRMPRNTPLEHHAAWIKWQMCRYLLSHTHNVVYRGFALLRVYTRQSVRNRRISICTFTVQCSWWAHPYYISLNNNNNNRNLLCLLLLCFHYMRSAIFVRNIENSDCRRRRRWCRRRQRRTGRSERTHINKQYIEHAKHIFNLSLGVVSIQLGILHGMYVVCAWRYRVAARFRRS